jgi:hypothetical protein
VSVSQSDLKALESVQTVRQLRAERQIAQAKIAKAREEALAIERKSQARSVRQEICLINAAVRSKVGSPRELRGFLLDIKSKTTEKERKKNEYLRASQRVIVEDATIRTQTSLAQKAEVKADEFAGLFKLQNAMLDVGQSEREEEGV